MRQLATTLALLVGFSATAHAAGPIHWATDLAQARAVAARENKPLLIHFWSPTCGPCKVADRDVFPNPDVASLINENFIPLKVNAAGPQQDLRNHFRIQQVPTDIISTVEGQELHRMITSTNAKQYANTLTALAKRLSPRQSEVIAQAQSPVMPASGVTPNGLSHTGMPTQPEATFPLANTEDMARRPGVDDSNRPGRGLMQPGVAKAFVPGMSNSGTKYASRYDAPPTQSTSPAPQQRPSSPASLTNRYVTGPNSSVASPSTPLAVAGPTAAGPKTPGEINNPYAQQSAPQQGTTAMRTDQQPAAVAANASRRSSPNAAPNSNHVVQGGQAKSRPHQQQIARQHPVQPRSVTQPPSSPPTATAPPPIGLDGRCPVTLISEGSWKKGDRRWGAVHRGKVYLFAGEEQQRTFLESPDDFSPVLAGMDVVRLADAGKVVEGTRRYGVLFDDDGDGPSPSRIYLFDSVESRNRFEATPDQFLKPVMQAMQQGTLHSLVR